MILLISQRGMHVELNVQARLLDLPIMYNRINSDELM